MSSFRLDLDDEGLWVWRLLADGQEIARSATGVEHTTSAYVHMRMLRRGQARLDPTRVDGGWSWQADGPGGRAIAVGRVLPDRASLYEEIPRVFHRAAVASIERSVPDPGRAPLFWTLRPLPV